MTAKKIISALFVTLLLSPAFAEEALVDNSFLMEEAYNQEPGVVQFIQSYQQINPDNGWAYAFTTEMPIGDENHQFAFSIPVSKINTSGTDETGIGDIGLNYRYRLYNSDTLTVTPSFYLILPTGDHKKGFGNGTAGLKYNHSVSVKLNETWTNHWNAGFSYTPDAKNSAGETASVFGYNFGTSMIYNYTPKTNWIFELVANNDEEVTGQDSKASSSSYYFVPGIRTAFAVGEETEVVPGIAAILGLGDSALQHETGVFVYLSIESKLW